MMQGVALRPPDLVVPAASGEVVARVKHRRGCDAETHSAKSGSRPRYKTRPPEHWPMISSAFRLGSGGSYFSKNTHFHDESCVIAPPSSGPTRNASAKIAEIRLVVKANRAGGTSSKKMATVTE
jgi:hypothetical protein